MSLKIFFLSLFSILSISSIKAQCNDDTACNFENVDFEPCRYVGDPCDDGNSMTFNDTYDANCNCNEGIAPFSGCTDPNACNYNSMVSMDDGSCLYIGGTCDDENPNSFNDTVLDDCTCEGEFQVDIVYNDTGGDGWSGSELTFFNTDSGVEFTGFFLDDGNTDTESINLPPGCYEVSASDDDNPNEVSYFVSVTSSDGNEDIFGGANETQIFSVGGISGCTDPDALNYNPEADCNTGDCYFCEEDANCTYSIPDGIQAGGCNEIEICGPGHYKIPGTSYSGYIGPSDPCHKIILSTPPIGYDVLMKPDFGLNMSIELDGTVRQSGMGDHNYCFYIDYIKCKIIRYIWDLGLAMITMNDDEGLGWSDMSYIILNEDYTEVAQGTLATAQQNNGTDFGADALSLDDGCYYLEICF